MTYHPPAKAQRLLALGLFGALLTLLWFGLVQPMMTYLGEHTEQRGISLRALRRDRALLQEASAVQAALASVEQSPRWQSFYASPKPESAILQMESDLRALLKSTNNPTSMTALPATSHGSLTRIAVKVTLSMRVDQLAEVLDRLQRQTKHLQIETLTVQSPDFQAVDANPTLTIQAEIVGFMVTPVAGRS